MLIEVDDEVTSSTYDMDHRFFHIVSQFEIKCTWLEIVPLINQLKAYSFQR